MTTTATTKGIFLLLVGYFFIPSLSHSLTAQKRASEKKKENVHLIVQSRVEEEMRKKSHALYFIIKFCLDNSCECMQLFERLFCVHSAIMGNLIMNNKMVIFAII
jgi:hypothetical protein